jgi:hypothetical protein
MSAMFDQNFIRNGGGIRRCRPTFKKLLIICIFIIFLLKIAKFELINHSRDDKRVPGMGNPDRPRKAGTGTLE